MELVCKSCVLDSWGLTIQQDKIIFKTLVPSYLWVEDWNFFGVFASTKTLIFPLDFSY